MDARVHQERAALVHQLEDHGLFLVEQSIAYLLNCQAPGSRNSIGTVAYTS